MPNYVQYSLSNLTGSLRKGDVALGVTTASIVGPTSTTGWYSGIIPATGKYVIYKTAASGDPDIFTPQTNTELFNFVLMQGGSVSNITSVSASLDWIGTQTNLLAANFDYENIVTDGLVLNLDAGFVGSYPTTSSTWYDISENNNNGTLINGPTFSSDNSGSIVFNGVNNYVGILNNTSVSFTIDCWINTTATSLNGTQAYEGNGIVWSDVVGGGNDFVLAILNDKASWFTGDTVTSINGTTTINTGAWFYLTVVKNGNNSTKQLYVNAISEGTGSSSANALTDNPNISIGGNTLDSQYFNGKIAQVKIYNRVLSESEILQNFNAQKGRFGL
jgi:hypothetical protein